MSKHVPQRKCVACGGHFPKAEMIKVIKNHEGFFIDEAQKKEGRGAYVCKSGTCINAAVLKKQFNRSFKTAVPETLYLSLKEYFCDTEAER